MNSSIIISDSYFFPWYEWFIFQGSFSGRRYNLYNAFAKNASLYIVSDRKYIEKRSLNGSQSSQIHIRKAFYNVLYLFVDNDDKIYLSLTADDEIICFSQDSTRQTRVAGSGTSGSNDNQLNGPLGVFVNSVGTIYIADSQNHRIMKWVRGATAGIRVAGDGTRGNDLTQLDEPTHVTVDAKEYIYISEAGNHRITRWAPNSTAGVCIAACTGKTSIHSTHLNQPHFLVFDSNGSLYVSDWGNHRVQKFSILPLLGE